MFQCKLFSSISIPERLSKDTTPTQPVVEHAISSLEEGKSYKPDIVVLLQPTSPLRTERDIDSAIEVFLKHRCESVISVCQTEHPLNWCLKKKKKYLEPIFGWKDFRKRRQDFNKIYLPNGAIFVAKPETLLKYRSFYTKKMLPYIMPPERSIDIDTELDLELAEYIIKKYKDKGIDIES